MRPYRHAPLGLIRTLVFSLLGVFTVAVAVQADVDPEHPVVAFTDKGALKGAETATMKKFLGIPYAAPPVGELRWRPPQPVTPWRGVRDATQFANHCPQPASPFGLPSVTEDCLYLNVFAPKHPSLDRDLFRGHPVMVWIHGGALFLGESDDYDPSKLVENEHVVVVTINYRLGLLGFLAHPALSAEADYDGSGNYGWMDQQAALDWVQRNIKHFGGDPNRVTIFGESAGGLSTHAQLASPEAAGLFHRAIVQSGAYFLNTTPLAAAEARGTAFATALGCPDQTAACLRSVPVETLLANQGSGGFTGNVDGKVLTQPIGSALQTGQFNRVPVMEGSNHDEWRLFVALNFELPTGIATDPTNYAARINASFGGLPLAPIVIPHYPLPNPPTPPGPSALGAVGTDGIFACNSRTSIRRLANFVPVFAYEFNDQNAPQLFLPPPVSGMPYGAYHAAEIQYVLGTRPSLPAQFVPPFSAGQTQLSNNMISYWGHFARKGNPNSIHTPNWPQYDANADLFQSLVAPTPLTESGFAADHQCAFWGVLLGTGN
ncbi:MAG: carboxylesterase/lipase family protein [Sulfurifustis sp.]